MSFPWESIGRHFCFQDGFLQNSPSIDSRHRTCRRWNDIDGRFLFDGFENFTVPKSNGKFHCRKSLFRSRLQ